MEPIIIIIHVLSAFAIVSLVLMQHGKGADVGAAFGSGSSNTMFGSQGAMPFLMKLTAVLALIFFITSISLSYIANHVLQSSQDVMSVPAAQTTQSSEKKTTAGELPFVPMPSTTDTKNKVIIQQ